MSDERHACPSPGCGELVPRHLFACKPHWFTLPRDLRATIGSTWRALGRPGDKRQALADYREATNEARGFLALEAGRCLIGTPGTSSGTTRCELPITVVIVDGDPVASCEAGHMFDGRRGVVMRA